VSGTTVTLNDVKILAEAAGVDLTRPLDEQLAGNGQQTDGLAARIDALAEKVDALAEKIAPPAGQHPANADDAFAQTLAEHLHKAQSPWISLDGNAGNQ
jgi:outer membrane murein-binding lipoprotein Lpp